MQRLMDEVVQLFVRPEDMQEEVAATAQAQAVSGEAPPPVKFTRYGVNTSFLWLMFLMSCVMLVIPMEIIFPMICTEMAMIFHVMPACTG